jgi:hypothetical protein
MARYFKSPHGGYADSTSFPSYGVIHDTPDTSTERSPNSDPVYPYGYVNLYHTPSKEHPNFNSRGGRKSDATELFTHTPAELHVNLMYADKRVRPHMMTVMALAKLDHPDAQIMSPNSLSNFSSKLARNAHERGLLKPSYDNPDMTTDDWKNENDWHARQVNTEAHIRNLKLGGGAVEIPRSEVMKGKQFLKETLRPKTASPTEPSAPAPKYDQPQLPGMEDK